MFLLFAGKSTFAASTDCVGQMEGNFAIGAKYLQIRRLFRSAVRQSFVVWLVIALIEFFPRTARAVRFAALFLRAEQVFFKRHF